MRATTAVGITDGLLPSARVKELCGGISNMTLWRWTQAIGFPQPDLVIQRRKFWRRSSVDRWLAEHRGEQTAPPGGRKTAA
jgi:predicted DNA-binding transcriptional regulator AlpA